MQPDKVDNNANVITSKESNSPIDPTSNKNEKENKNIKSTPTLTKEKEDQKGQIYEQKKLENVFQQKRSGVGKTNFQFSSLFQLDASSDTNATKVGTTPIEKKGEKSNIIPTANTTSTGGDANGFSFSFDLAKDETKNEDKVVDDMMQDLPDTNTTSSTQEKKK